MALDIKEDPASKRKSPRIPFEKTIVFHEPWQFEAKGIDIGAGGIGVEAEYALEIGQKVEVEIFPGYAKAHGEVRWMLPVEEGYRIGVMFNAEDWSIIEIVLSLQKEEA